jgi:hypothetical protein
MSYGGFEYSNNNQYGGFDVMSGGGYGDMGGGFMGMDTAAQNAPRSADKKVVCSSI